MGGAVCMGPAPVEDEAHYWAECPALRPARQRMRVPGLWASVRGAAAVGEGARACFWGTRWHVAAGGAARGVGARCAGGGAFWGGDCGAVPGAGAGHVAHGALAGFPG